MLWEGNVFADFENNIYIYPQYNPWYSEFLSFHKAFYVDVKVLAQVWKK